MLELEETKDNWFHLPIHYTVDFIKEAGNYWSINYNCCDLLLQELHQTHGNKPAHPRNFISFG